MGEFDGKKDVVAFETYGKGFGGDIGVITAVNVNTDKIVGVAVTTHSETPGVGSKQRVIPNSVLSLRTNPSPTFSRSRPTEDRSTPSAAPPSHHAGSPPPLSRREKFTSA